MNDTISRQAVIENICTMLRNCFDASDEMIESVKITVGELPSAQPQLPEWAQKVEEYRKIAHKTFSSPIAWALYQTWREYAERRTDDR